MYRIIIWKMILIYTVVGMTGDDFDDNGYDDHKIFEVTPKTKKLLSGLNDLKKYEGIYFLTQPKHVNEKVIIMVSPEQLPVYYDLMFENEVSYIILYENAQQWINRTKYNREISFNFFKFHTVNEIYKELDSLAKRYPKSVKTVVGGRTYENREIKGVKISFKANNPGIFIEGGINSRNWMSPAVVMYVLHQLLTSRNKNVKKLAKRHNWYIFPLFNPDGYEYTHSKPLHRDWLKTRKPYNNSCIGTNLNMNWDYKWNTVGTLNEPCSIYYAGSAPFSEIEAKSMSEYIKTISDKFYAYISINNNEPYILFPYGFTTDHVKNYDELMAIGNKMKDILENKYNVYAFVGSIAKKTGMTSGSTVDYIRGVYGTRLVYMYPLYHSLDYNIPPEQILQMGQQTLDSFVAMFKEARRQENKKNFDL